MRDGTQTDRSCRRAHRQGRPHLPQPAVHRVRDAPLRVARARHAADAATQLRYALADVERGTWQPPQPVEAAPEPTTAPSFHQLAEQWWVMNETDLQPRTQVDYQWRLDSAFFGDGDHRSPSARPAGNIAQYLRKRCQDPQHAAGEPAGR